MSADISVVVTGVGIVCPSGIGREAAWKNLIEGRNAIGPVRSFDPGPLPIRAAGEIEGFDPAQYVKPRKALKVMARDAQLALAAAALARADANLSAEAVDPDRFGVVSGGQIIRNEIQEVAKPFQASTVDGEFHWERWGGEGLAACFPLEMLKLLPNMLGSHVSINQDARGPNNTLCMGEASGLLAAAEAASVIRRGWADWMLAGSASCRINCYDFLRLSIADEVSHAEPERASRPFDADRDGQVFGEGAGTLMLESRAAAERRGANIRAVLRGAGSACIARHVSQTTGPTPEFEHVRTAVRRALADARMSAAEIGFVSAHGLSTREGDRREAAALRDVLPGVPVFAPKSYFGNLEAGCGSVEASIAVLALEAGRVPATLHYERPDPECPIDVIHGRPLDAFKPACVVVNYTRCGQAAAVVLSRE
jgi:3-oxoacyl-[acyl-carrier-protein] synthase II